MNTLLLNRLILLIGKQDLGNGMPLAHATADAIVLEAKTLQKKESDLRKISDSDLKGTAEAVFAFFNGRSRPNVSLPFGTEMISQYGLVIGDKVYVPDASRPGLFDTRFQSMDLHGPNLERLVNGLQNSNCLALEDYDRADAAEAYYDRLLPCIEFKPQRKPSIPKLVYHFPYSDQMPFSRFLPYEIDWQIEIIERDFDNISRNRNDISLRIKQIESAWEKYLVRKSGYDAPSLDDVLLSPIDKNGSSKLVLLAKFPGLDDRLRVCSVLKAIPDDSKLSSQFFYHFFKDLRFKRQRREVLGPSSQQLSISAVAASIFQLFGMSERTDAINLAKLREVFEVELFELGIDCSFYWSSGRLMVDLRHWKWHIKGDEICVYEPYPDSVVHGFVSKPIENIVDLPCPAEGTILEGFASKGKTYFKIQQASFLYDTRTGKVGKDPICLP